MKWIFINSDEKYSFLYLYSWWYVFSGYNSQVLVGMKIVCGRLIYIKLTQERDELFVSETKLNNASELLLNYNSAVSQVTTERINLQLMLN